MFVEFVVILTVSSGSVLLLLLFFNLMVVVREKPLQNSKLQTWQNFIRGKI